MTRTQSLVVLFALTGCPAVVPEEPEPEVAELLPAEGEWALRLREGVAYGDCGGLFGAVPERGEEAEPLPLEPDGDDYAAEWEEDEDAGASRDDEGDPDEEIDCSEGDEGAYCELPEPEPGPSFFSDVLLEVDLRHRGERGFVVDVDGIPVFARVRDGRFEGEGGERWGDAEPGFDGSDADVGCGEAGASGMAVEPACVAPEPSSGVSLFVDGELEGATAMHGLAWLELSDGGWHCSVEVRFDAARLSDFRDRRDDEPVVAYGEDVSASGG